MNYQSKILRIIDANINRSKEGLRVCEDIMRLIADEKISTLKLKKIRHQVSTIIKKSQLKEQEIIQNRNSKFDVGKKINIKNSKKTIYNIFFANSQRVKEALRVLEEISEIFDKKTSNKFQNLRFKFYDTEKECFKKIRYLYNS